MQREILFRGKSTGEAGTWIYGYYHYDKSLLKHYICSTETLVRYEVRPETIGQFTGRRDKNEKEVYDGDILKVEDYLFVGYEGANHLSPGEKYESIVAEVYWVSGAFMMDRELHIPLFDPESEIMEVLGNIHDKKELLQSL